MNNSSNNFWFSMIYLMIKFNFCQYYFYCNKPTWSYHGHKKKGGRDKMSKYFFLSVCSKQTVMLQTHINMLEKNFKYLLETKNPYLMDGRNVTLNTKINSLTSKHIRKKISWKCIFNNTTSYYWVLLILSRMKFWFNFECMLVTQTKVVAYQKML